MNNRLVILASVIIPALSIGFNASAAGILENVDLSYEAGVKSDNVEQGLSQTAGRVGGYGEINAAVDDFYVNGTINNVSFTTDKATTVTVAIQNAKNPKAQPKKVTKTTVLAQVTKAYEVDLSGGWSPSAWGNKFDFGLTYATYFGGSATLEKPSVELYATAYHPFGAFEPGVEIHYTPSEGNVNARYVGTIKDELYLELNAKYKFTKHIIANAAIGYSSASSGSVSGPTPQFKNYSNYGVGVEYILNEHVSFDLSYSDTDSGATNFFTPAIAGGRASAGLKVSF